MWCFFEINYNEFIKNVWHWIAKLTKQSARQHDIYVWKVLIKIHALSTLLHYQLMARQFGMQIKFSQLGIHQKFFFLSFPRKNMKKKRRQLWKEF